MKMKSKTTAYIVHSIAAAGLLLTAQISLAGSATWLLSPQDSAWENANNWTPGGPPNGPSDIATFAQSSQTNVNISTPEEVNSIVFTAGSSSFGFDIYEGKLIISGTGVINNSSALQGFGTEIGGQIIFNNASTAASAQMQIRIGNGVGGQTIFNNTSNAAGVSIANSSGFYEDSSFGRTIFNDASSAGHASINNYGGSFTHETGGQTIFNGTSTAGHATITSRGGSDLAWAAPTRSSMTHRLPTAQSLSLMEVEVIIAVRLFLMVLRRAAPRGWRFLTMVT
jgi:hypothetical protein